MRIAPLTYHGLSGQAVVETYEDLVKHVSQVSSWTDEAFMKVLSRKLLDDTNNTRIDFQRAANVAGVLIGQIPKWLSGQDLPRVETRAEIAHNICRAR